ncbi:Uncharacterized protein SCF082_LOCUS34010 [Durusdinium trenchii]|uniref:Uncharacterized protein n=1 Tax=Durusdinium trenchii TaxID=1381693 RepID=A0ABP0NTD7_9DINO
MATAKPQLPGRLNELKSDAADQEVWAKSKARQTYRKSVLAAQSNKSSSDSEDGEKPVPTTPKAEASKEGSQSREGSEDKGPRLSNSSRTRSPSGGSGSYQARRTAAKAKAAAANAA